ncbi:GntR family transcriptional regulator [uncultured Cohaesibacter sp.]|uniref:GntR family transcriptional regulator n=1 Tax=uncultured Cohaesibacter sp. TaxID=1002546 RepID=UPI002AAB724F|nr:GntR family transcriptional regulator [uncultured Cohaesibacter sp.]
MTEPLAKRAYTQIIEMIFSGELKVGDALQEAKLGEQLDMSRTPVREAINRIQAEGLAKKSGRFLRVRLLSPAEVEEIFFLRSELEVYSARMALKLPKSTLEAMQSRIEALLQAGPGEGEEHWQVDEDFHGMLTRATHNQTLISTVNDLRLRTCMFDHTRVRGRFLKGNQEHLTILQALEDGDEEQVKVRMAQHIDNAKQAILERLAGFSAAAPEI